MNSRGRRSGGPRTAAYVDYAYGRQGEVTTAQHSFALFLRGVSARVGGMLLIGRLVPGEAVQRYPVGSDDLLQPLPYYPSLSRPVAVLRAIGGSLRAFWSALGDVDRIWVFGPHPLALPLLAAAALRRRRIVLGVRQDFPAYMRTRHRRRGLLLAIAWVLELLFRLLALRTPVVVVGPELARAYRRSRHLLEISVSLVEPEQIVEPDAAEHDYSGELIVLSVGRLDAEKNPLLLADVAAELQRRSPGRWRMRVCGDGPLRDQLSARLSQLGVADRVELLGHVPNHDGLADEYRTAHVLLHVSWTEGFPQVLLEAFAGGAPVVATDVGGVRAAVGGRVVLIPPGDAAAAAAGLERVAASPELRRELRCAGHDYVSRRTLTAEAKRAAAFLQTAAPCRAMEPSGLGGSR